MLHLPPHPPNSEYKSKYRVLGKTFGDVPNSVFGGSVGLLEGGYRYWPEISRWTDQFAQRHRGRKKHKKFEELNTGLHDSQGLCSSNILRHQG